MNTGLDEFISEVKLAGMANANRYFVMISGANKIIGLFCENAQLPGTQILSTPARTFGEVREVPYELQYDPVTLSLYIDNNWAVKKYFDEWRTEVFDFKSRVSGYYGIEGSRGYAKDVTIYCYNKDSQETYTVRLREAFPKTIGSVNLDYGNKEIPRLAVTLQYAYWEPLEVPGQPNTVSDTGENSVNEPKGIFGESGHAPAYSGGAAGQSAWASSFGGAMKFAGMEGTGLSGGLPGGFGNNSVDFGSILGGYFQNDPFQSMSASSFLTSFGGFQDTFNSFKSNPKGAVGSLGKFLV